MGKACPDAVLDTFLDKIATGTIMTACSAEPSTRAEAVTTYALADITITAGDGNGDWVIADDTSGRKLTLAEQADVDIDASDDATHIAICDGSDLLYVTTCTTQGLVSGGTVTFPAWKINIPDPT